MITIRQEARNASKITRREEMIIGKAFRTKQPIPKSVGGLAWYPELQNKKFFGYVLYGTTSSKTLAKQIGNTKKYRTIYKCTISEETYNELIEKLEDDMMNSL